MVTKEEENAELLCVKIMRKHRQGMWDPWGHHPKPTTMQQFSQRELLSTQRMNILFPHNAPMFSLLAPRKADMSHHGPKPHPGGHGKKNSIVLNFKQIKIKYMALPSSLTTEFFGITIFCKTK